MNINANTVAVPVVTATAGNRQVTLCWNAVEGFPEYQVISLSNGIYSIMAKTDETSAELTELQNNKEYIFIVKAIAGNSDYVLSDKVTVIPQLVLDKPVLTVNAAVNIIYLSWSEVEYADCYEIVRIDNDSFSTLARTKAVSAEIRGEGKADEYTYLVRAVSSESRPSSSEAVNVVMPKELAKPCATATPDDSEIEISWSQVDGADRYEVILLQNGQHTLLGTVSGTNGVISKLENGAEYTFLIKAVDNDGRTSLSEAVSAVPFEKQLQKPVVSVRAGYRKAFITWQKVDKATQYQITSQDNEQLTEIATLEPDMTSYTVSELDNGTEYAYCVKAVNSRGDCEISDPLSVIPCFGKPVISTERIGTKLQLSWTKTDGAQAYEIIQTAGTKQKVLASLKSPSTVNLNLKGVASGIKLGFSVKATAGDGSVSVSETVEIITD